MACERKLLESEATTGFFVRLGTKGKKEWCMKANLIASRYECPRCKKEMNLQERKGTVDGYEWCCRSQSKDNPHDVVRSVRKGTWFSESKLAITIILRLMRYWFGKSMNAFVVNDDLTVTNSQAPIKTVSGYNLYPSKLEFECKLINSFLCTRREVMLQWIPSHCDIHGNEQDDKLAKEVLTLHPHCLPMPSDFSGTNFDRREFPFFQTWLLANLGLICLMAKDELSFPPYLRLRVWHVSESSPDMITCKPICLRLA
ncbi:uncharacterized protein TNCV_1386581 [Trichonephila clavipes]|nr:uncharacterized protein TNCV_1386581 [Trichonephila clavipes]